MEEQGKQKPKLFVRLFIFLNTPQGQIVANCCAYGSLICVAISALSSDYSRLIFPFAITTPLLAFLGAASRHYRRIAQVTLVLWVIPLNSFAPVLFNIGTQAGQQTHLQTQIVQLENLHNRLQRQKTTLNQQQILLQKQITSGNAGQVVTQVEKDAGQTTTTLLSNTTDTLQYINYLVNYDIHLQNNNDRDLAIDALIGTNQSAIDTSDQEIKDNQQLVETLNQAIENNNALLPTDKNVQPGTWVDQVSCVSGYPCQERSWLQPIVDSWQRVTQTATIFRNVALLAFVNGRCGWSLSSASFHDKQKQHHYLSRAL